MKVVIAPDSFKGSIDAAAAAEQIAVGWAAERPTDEIVSSPQADGGEGTSAVVARAVLDTVWHAVGPVTGPDGRPVDGGWLRLPDGTGLVELAVSSGLPLMAAPDPLGATTRGMGEVLRAALTAGATRLVVALGGSASIDGATGALAALGARWLDHAGRELPDGGGTLGRLVRVELSGLLAPPPGGVELLVDVEQPLLGPNGAAAVFGPQKGASPSDVAILDGALARLARVLGGDPDRPGAGAAGGTGYGLATAWGAVIVPGAARIAEMSGLSSHLADADVLLSGEGRFDRTSLQGKVVGNALRLARDHGVRTGVVAGVVDPTVRAVTWTCALADLAGDPAASMREPLPYLRRAGQAAARDLGGWPGVGRPSLRAWKGQSQEG